MVEPETHLFPEDGRVPNSSLPTLVYRGVGPTDPDRTEELLRDNEWPAEWRTTIGFFRFPHYHSNVHEVIAVTRGMVAGRIGGSLGSDVTLAAGDVVVLPAGTGHLHISASDDLMAVGGYPVGSEEWNLHRAVPSGYAWAKERIARVPIPQSDPLYGKDGPLARIWGHYATGAAGHAGR